MHAVLPIRLDIPFYALDFEVDFNRIIDHFADEYLAGRTPNPCVLCNNWLKFGKLWSYGKQLGADFIATGHYAQVVRPEKGSGYLSHPQDETFPCLNAKGNLTPFPAWPELHCGADPDKDQSYVLFGLGRGSARADVIPHRRPPQGGSARRWPARLGWLCRPSPTAWRSVSCPTATMLPSFAGAGRCRQPQVHVVDTAGNVLTEHAGIENFTIGQRKGLKFAAGQRRYVLRILPTENKVVIGSREELLAPA